MAKYKLDQWKEFISEWQVSGKARQTFCQERDVTVATFSYWRTKIKKMEAACNEPQGKNGFIRYSLTPAMPGGFIIEWPEGLKLLLPMGVGNDEITALINLLRRPR